MCWTVISVFVQAVLKVSRGLGASIKPVKVVKVWPPTEVLRILFGLLSAGPDHPPYTYRSVSFKTNRLADLVWLRSKL